MLIGENGRVVFTFPEEILQLIEQRATRTLSDSTSHTTVCKWNRVFCKQATQQVAMHVSSFFNARCPW